MENLRFTDEVQDAGGGEPGVKPDRRKQATAAQLKGDAALASVLRNANIITNQRPDFDSRSYGYGKLSDLIKATSLFEIERHSPGDGKQALMYAREKRRAPATRRTPAAKTAKVRVQA